MIDAILGWDWVTQYAIRMPSGQLYSRVIATSQQQPEDLTQPSWQRDMVGFMSMFGARTPQQQPQQPAEQTFTAGEPFIYATEAEAQKTLDNIRRSASFIGIPNYGGAVVQRICSPFTTSDETAEFATEAIKWLEQQSEKP